MKTIESNIEHEWKEYEWRCFQRGIGTQIDKAELTALINRLDEIENLIPIGTSYPEEMQLEVNRIMKRLLMKW